MIAAGLLARHRATHGHKQRFLYRIVTGDEKWCLRQHEAAKRMAQSQKTSTTASKTRTSSSEENAVCVVGLGRNHSP